MESFYNWQTFKKAMHCYVGHKICVVLTFSVYVQFPRVRDTSFTGVTVEECKVLLSGTETHFICVP